MNEENALGIIEQMILDTRYEIKDNGFHYMLWGYMVFVSALTDYFLLMAENENHSLVWAITMPLAGIVSFIQGRREKKERKVKTYIEDVLQHTLVAYGICLFLVCLIMPMNEKHWQSFYPVLMVVYGFGLYTTGGIIRYKPLQYGALFVWAISCVSFFFGYDMQLLCLALGVLGGFIIPGHLLHLRSNRHV